MEELESLYDQKTDQLGLVRIETKKVRRSSKVGKLIKSQLGELGGKGFSGAESTDEKRRLSKPWKRVWSVVVVVVFVWSLPALPSDTKPWKHLVRHVSSTAISVAGVVLVVTLLALINISELEHAWARLRGESTSPQNAPKRNPPNLSVLDPLTPLDLPVAAPDLSGFVVTYDGEIVPRVLAQPGLPKHDPVPDFSPEFDRFAQIDLHYQPTEEWDATCQNWVDDVRSKLEEWNHRFAQRFDAPELSGLGGAVIWIGRPDIEENPVLEELHMKQSRLRQILKNP